MQDKESSLPDDWFKKGDDDKQAVGILLEHGGKSSVAAFLIQQMLAQKATAFYFLERYPFFGGELSREEIENAYHESLKLIEKIDKLYRQIRY